MSRKLDLCHSIQLGSDPGESSGVVQAWNQQRIRKNEGKLDSSLCNLGNKAPRSQLSQQPCPGSQVTSEEMCMAWIGRNGAQDAMQYKHERDASRREARVSLCLTDSE
jgi:hypothetical protein